MLVQEQYVNRTENFSGGDSGLYEPFTDNVGELFLAMQREHGRCTGKVYIDTPEGSKQIGWVFEKLRPYSDADENFLAETWISLHEKEPTKTIEHHYLLLS